MTTDAPERIRATVTRLASAGACRVDTDCVALPMGLKACGGPEGFVATLATGSHRAELDRALAGYDRARREQIARTGELSTCMIEPNPGARCHDGRCTLRPRLALGTD